MTDEEKQAEIEKRFKEHFLEMVTDKQGKKQGTYWAIDWRRGPPVELQK